MILVNIEDICTGRILFVGVGNRQRRDDGAGPIIIDRLTAAGLSSCIDAGTVLENYTKNIIDHAPDTVLIIDAVNFHDTPGKWRLFNPRDLDEVAFSTHAASLQLFASYINQRISAQIYLLGIQPESIEFLDGLSPAVEDSVNEIVDIIINHL